MLGQEIATNPCLLDYYNKLAEVTQFNIIGKSILTTSSKAQNMHQYHVIIPLKESV